MSFLLAMNTTEEEGSNRLASAFLATDRMETVRVSGEFIHKPRKRKLTRLNCRAWFAGTGNTRVLDYVATFLSSLPEPPSTAELEDLLLQAARTVEGKGKPPRSEYPDLAILLRIDSLELSMVVVEKDLKVIQSETGIGRTYTAWPPEFSPTQAQELEQCILNGTTDLDRTLRKVLRRVCDQSPHVSPVLDCVYLPAPGVETTARLTL